MSYYNNYECELCGEYSDGYPLCYDCYCEEQYNYRKQDEHKERFYDSKKFYSLKKRVLTDNEKRFFHLAKQVLAKDLIITPQANLQSFIDTDSITRNDELFRNIDFVIFNAEDYIPLLAIELNEYQHYTNPHYIKRDKSVKMILKVIGLPLVTLETEMIEQKSDNELRNIIKSIINSYI